MEPSASAADAFTSFGDEAAEYAHARGSEEYGMTSRGYGGPGEYGTTGRGPGEYSSATTIMVMTKGYRLDGSNLWPTYSSSRSACVATAPGGQDLCFIVTVSGLQVVEQSEQTKTSQAIKPPAPQSSSSVGQQSEDVSYFTVLYAKYQPNKKVCQATAIYNAAKSGLTIAGIDALIACHNSNCIPCSSERTRTSWMAFSNAPTSWFSTMPKGRW
jgi:hypothetical protein